MLVFDLGAYRLDTSIEYLSDGHKVIGVDANPEMIDNIKKNYKFYIEDERLILLNNAITSQDNNVVEFYISECELWSSLNKNVAEREKPSIKKILVNTVSIKTLFERYGVPDYLKIDIEGADILVINDLKNIKKLPKIISAETECLGKGESTEGLDVVNALRDAGYTKFYLENQKAQHVANVFEFPFVWMTYDECVKMIKYIKNKYKYRFNKNYDFWWDVYATY